MMNRLRVLVTLILLGFISAITLSSTVDARGRIGSHRVGGYNSHGKGSHYYGGF
jgi:hypothetical protein